MKTFEQWNNERDNFWESYIEDIVFLENKMRDEGMKIDTDNFYDDISALDMETDFEDDLFNAVSEFEKIYRGKVIDDPNSPNYGDYSTTPEHDRVVKLVDKTTRPYFKLNSMIKSALFRNAVEKNWEKWKKIYQKWIDYLHANRGKLAAKNFGI